MSKIVKTVIVVAIAVAVVVFAPQIAAVLASVAGSLGVTVAATAISSALIGMGISMALTATASLFRKAPSMSQSMVDRLNTSVVPTASRKIIFGTTAGGADVRFFEGDIDLPSTKKDGYVQVIALASHRINALKQFYVENDLVWQNGSFVSKRNGFAPSNPLRVVTEGKPGNGFAVGSGRYWNSSSTFTGCAYYVPFWKLDEEVWESGIPQRLTAIVEGCPLYDPRRDSTRGGSGAHRVNDQTTYAFRDGTVEIGRNPALALLTYLLGWRINGKVVWGMGIPANRIDFDNFRTYANLCEERVAVQGGGTVQRYTADGIFSTTDSHETVINGLTAAMGSCKLTDRGGTYCIVGGYDDTAGPKIAFDADDLVAPANGSSPYISNPAPASRERFNIVRGRFANPDELYQLTDWGDPIEREPLADGIPRTMSIDLGAVSRAETCQRIAKQILLREYLCPGMFAATFGPKAFAVEIGSVITLSLPAEGWNNKLFRVMEQAESHDLFFQMTLREEDPAIYAWDREEKPLPANIRPQGYDASTTIAPANLALTSASYAGANGINVSEVHVTWTPEMSGRVNGIQIQSRPAGTDAWSEQAALFDPKIGMFTFTSNAPGITVEVQARFRMMSAVYSPWVNANVATAPVLISYDSVDGTPSNLADINPTEGGKLGGIAAGATVGAPVGSHVGSIPVADVVTKINALTTAGFTDTQAPPVPTGLALASVITDASATLNITWNAVSASDLAGYVIALREGGTTAPFIEYTTTGNSYSRTAIPRNVAITAKVLAYDKAGNRSAFSATVSHTTARDTVPPAVPTNLNVEPSLTTGFVSFTAPSDSDVSRVHFNLLKNGAALKNVSVNVRPGMNGTATFSNLDRSTQYGVQAFAIDTSDNVSATTSTVLFTTAGGISAGDFTPGLSGFQTVTALPDPVGYKGPSLVYNQTDATLYTYSNGAWSAPTATAVIPDGSITPSKLNVKLGGGNLVRNSSFEHKIRVEATYATLGAGYGSYDNAYPNDGPTSWSVIDGGRRGGKAQSINWTSNTSSKGIFLLDDGIANNLRLLQPNRTYMFSFYAVGQGSALGSGINLAFNVFPQITPITAPAVTGDWQRWVFKLVTGAQVDTNIFLTTSYYGPNPGFMYIDDIQLEEGDVVTAYSPALLSGEITGPLLAEGAVTVGKIGDLAITETKIASDAISAPKIKANAIEATKIATDAIETRHVKAGAIKTDELDANAVTANKLAVGAVVADKIAAGSINVSHLLVGNMNQLNPDPGFRDTGFWYNNGVSNGPLGTAAGSVTGWYNSHGPDINGLIGTTQFAMLWAGYFNSTGRQHLLSPRRKNIKGGTVYELSGFGWNSSNQAFTALIRFYNVDGTFLTDAALSWQAGTSGAKAIQFTAPPTTNSYEFIVYNASGPKFTDYCIIANLQVSETSGATAIQDGAITTDKISAGSVTANKVAANSITANHIQAGTIGAAQIATGALTARVIATGNPDNIVPDGDFRDASWWNSNTPDGRLNVIDVTFANFRRALSITPGGGFDFFSPMFTVEPGATYKFTMAVHTIGFNGQFLATLHMPGIQWYSLKNGAACDPSIINSANGTTTNVSETYETTYTVPVGASYFNSWQFRLNGGFTGEVQFAVKIVRVSDSTLIKDGAITTEKLTVGAVTADKILAGTITGDKFNTGTNLPGTITVGNTGVAIGTTAAQAANGTTLKWYDASSGNQYNFYGSRIQRDAPTNGWYSNAYTTEGFRNAAKISALMDTPDTFFGLCTFRPYNNGNDYQYINYSIHRSSNGTVYAYEYGAAVPLVPDAGNGHVYSIIYDGKCVTYVRDNDNATLRVVGAPAGMTVFGAVSLYSQSSAVSRVAMTGGMDNSLNGSDPAARINAYSTTIDPGRVLIQGGTTLDAWRDQTEIRGGAIKTNSVSAEKIAINARGISVIGCDFEYGPNDGRLYWRDGHVLYTDDAGNPASPYIPAGSVAWGGGSYNYIMWDKGAGGFRQVVDNWEQAQVRNSNSIIMCTWRNGPSFVANYGGTIVHGDRITTRTISADRMNVNSLSAISANVGTVTAGLVRSTSGNAYFDLDNARIVFNNGSVMKVQGVGFGSANQFIEWFGPVQSSFTSCTEANATYYLKTNGSAYFGGSLSAGVLKNSVQTTSQAYDASVTTGTFGSNGKSRVITVGYQASSSTNITGQCPTPYTPYATVRLFRGTSAGGTLLAEQTFNGSHSCSPGAGQFEPGSMVDGIGGSITYTDNTGGSSSSYFVQIVGRNIMTTNLAQSLGVTSVEQ
jgi:hypothetical protein